MRAGTAAIAERITGAVMTTTNSSLEHDLSSPIWTLGHIAQAFSKSTRTAREYSRRHDFPAPRTIGGKDLLWLREDVLAWFIAQPTLDWVERFAARSAACHARGGVR